MNSLIIAGSLLLGWNGAAQTANDTTEYQSVFNEPTCEVQDARTQLDQIVFIENEEEVVLNFDTADYLPEGFDPYVGNLDDIVYIDMQEEQEIELGYETAQYLPKGFDAYAGDLNAIVYVENEEPVELGFDTAAYLPKGFDAHLGNYNDLAFIEAQEEIELGFDTAAYLPRHFDPHVGDLDLIVYKELDYIILKKLEIGQELAELEQ